MIILPPYSLNTFFAKIDLSRGGSVFYEETQDTMLISRSTREVRNAFPNQPAFNPESLFIVTWFQVFSIDVNIPGVS